MDDILVVDEDLVDINCDGNRQSDNKKGKHSSGGRMAKGEKKSKKKLCNHHFIRCRSCSSSRCGRFLHFRRKPV